MRAVDLIRRKRDSGELTSEEIQQLIASYTLGDIPDYQMSAWLMAVVLRGMSRPEIAALTEAMLHSGRVLDFSDLAGRKVDKHSTGGVGDKTSLVIAPIVAAGGLKVPMISGRGLGHSGGTLDKLESILYGTTAEDDESVRITARLEAIVSKWRESRNRTDEAGTALKEKANLAEKIESSSDDEVFDFLGKELGIFEHE